MDVLVFLGDFQGGYSSAIQDKWGPEYHSFLHTSY